LVALHRKYQVWTRRERVHLLQEKPRHQIETEVVYEQPVERCSNILSRGNIPENPVNQQADNEDVQKKNGEDKTDDKVHRDVLLKIRRAPNTLPIVSEKNL
jgi:hypothetical protein